MSAKNIAVDEVLDNWEEEQFNDWYAVDKYLNGSVTRLYVGREDRAREIADDYVQGSNLAPDGYGNPLEPGWNGAENTPFYRFLGISADDAKAYFKDRMEELSTDWITQKVASEMLGVSKGRVSQLAKSGQLDTMGKLVSRADVEKRMEGVSVGRPKKA